MSSLEMYLNRFCLPLEFRYFIIHFVFIQLLETIALTMIVCLTESFWVLFAIDFACFVLHLFQSGTSQGFVLFILILGPYPHFPCQPSSITSLRVFSFTESQFGEYTQIHVSMGYGSPWNLVINQHSQWWSLGQVRNPHLNINEWEMDDFMIPDLSALIH